MRDIKVKDLKKIGVKTVERSISHRMRKQLLSQRKIDKSEEQADDYDIDKVEMNTELMTRRGVKRFAKSRQEYNDRRREEIRNDEIVSNTEERLTSAHHIYNQNKTTSVPDSYTETRTVNNKRVPARYILNKDRGFDNQPLRIKTADTYYEYPLYSSVEDRVYIEGKRYFIKSKTGTETKTAPGLWGKVKTGFQNTVHKVTMSVKKTAEDMVLALFGSSSVMTVIMILFLIAMMIGSVYGIFFSGNDSGSGMTMQSVVREINEEFNDKIKDIQDSVSYDYVEITGNTIVWKDIIATYAVRVSTDSDDPLNTATMDDGKKLLLTKIFWDMTEISYHTQTVSETVIIETEDEDGNIVQEETTIEKVYLYIDVKRKTAEEIAVKYGFNPTQKMYLEELLKPENDDLWKLITYDLSTSSSEIVAIGLSQVGNIGGQPYWSWYGFSSRVEWCACFVSWCANEAGLIDSGAIPKFSTCVVGVQWYKDNGRWQDSNYIPSPGDIIFFDWNGDGLSEHVGIVERYENNTVYTVEGNADDRCLTKAYTAGSKVILGYGVY